MIAKLKKLFLVVVLSSMIGVSCKEDIPAPHDDTLVIPTTTMEALTALYNSTAGDEWSCNEGWFEDDYNAWYGVTFDLLTGDVTSIDLDNNNLTGTIPTQVANLGELSELTLSNNNLAGTVPEALLSHANWESWNVETNILTQNDGYGFDNSDILDPTNHDLDLLKEIYNTLGGELWSDTTNWLSAKSLDQWYGVATNSDGRVTEIKLGGNNLEGDISNILFSTAQYLTTLDLGSNNLSGAMPLSIIEIEGLKSCILSQNLYTDEIPLSYTKHEHYSSWDVVNQQNGVVLSEEADIDATTMPDYAALVAIYDALSGDNWSDNTNWARTDQSYKYWYGVEIDEEYRVTALSLPSNALSGSLPAEIADLERLTSLDLSGNNITGAIPAEVANMSSLTSLILSGNKMSGDIDSDVLGNENYSAWNAMDNILPQQDGYGLSISDRDILAIFYRAMDGENWLVDNNWLSDDALGDWEGIDTDSDGKIVTIDFVDNFGGYAIEIGFNGTVPEELGLLTKITKFRMRANASDTYGILVAGDCNTFMIPTLEYLQLNNMGITGELDGEKIAAMTSCYFFQMNQCRINNRTPSETVTGPIPEEFSNLTLLTELNIANNGFTGNIPETFTKAYFPNMGTGKIQIQWNAMGSSDGTVIPADVEADIDLFGSAWRSQYGVKLKLSTE